MVPDPYKVLGLSPDATEEEVTRTYRQLAKKYHPDLNPNNPEAARKMSEINAAYQQIKNGAGAGESYEDYRQYGPKSGFGGWSNQYQRRPPSPFDPVRRYLSAGCYQEALYVLSGISQRAGSWYYYSAAANYGAGNKLLALEHAQTAVQMEPQNEEYRRLYNQIQRGGHVYSQYSRGYGRPVRASRFCLWYLIAQMLCFCCCRGGYGWFGYGDGYGSYPYGSYPYGGYTESQPEESPPVTGSADSLRFIIPEYESEKE